jgi:hypothetical protein
MIEFLHKFALWRCRVLDWHKAPKAVAVNGPNMTGRCPRCNARVCEDSQGNWFSLERYP